MDLAADHLAEYERDGYTIVRSAYTPAECDEFVNYMLDLHAGRIQVEGFAPRAPDDWSRLRHKVFEGQLGVNRHPPFDLPSRHNGVTLCSGMDIPGGDVPALVRAFAGKIHFCQIRDHTERWPGGREVPPGEGSMDLTAIVAALREVGYDGFVHLEHLGKPRYEGEDLEAKALDYFKSLIASA